MSADPATSRYPPSVSRIVVGVVALVAAVSTSGCSLTTLLEPAASPPVSVDAQHSRDDGYYACLNLPRDVAREMHDPKKARATAGLILAMLSQTFPHDQPGPLVRGCASALHVPVRRLVG
jgi:hypothetical protein